LSEGESRRGCKPADVKTFASISDQDFNELFTPLKDRGAVIMYDQGMHELDDGAKKVLEEKWFQRKGARYFFVVARASKSGNQAKNRALSHRRANSVMYHLTSLANDPEIDKKVGLLWLGNEFAQLSQDYCAWGTSRPNEKCDEEAINRSAFVSWVDCRL
jgi:outer membrane protein OmpA-like peptidoglycan-associated protein